MVIPEPSPPSPQAGFTLVEVIVSMVLLGLAALLVLPAIVTAQRAAVANRDISRATQYASAELAMARTTASTSCGSVVAAHGRSLTSPVGYTITDSVTGSCPTGAGGVSTLTVTTTVTSAANTARSAAATTVILVTS